MITVPPRSTISRAVSIAVSSERPRRIGKAPRRERSQPCHRLSNSSTLATNCIRRAPGQQGADHERVEEAAVVRGDDHPTLEAGRARDPCAGGGTRSGSRARAGPWRGSRATRFVPRARARGGGSARSAPALITSSVRGGAEAPRALVHRNAYTHARAALLAPSPGSPLAVLYQARSISSRISLSPGTSGVSLQLGALEDAVHRGVELGAVGAELGEAAGPAAELLDPLPAAPRAWCPAPGRARSSACRRAGSAPRSSTGGASRWSRACGIRSARTSVWQTTWWRPNSAESIA